MVERRRWHLVLQGSDGGQGLFRQQVGARTEELSQFDHQHAEFDGRLAKDHQHFNQHIDVWLHFIITASPGPHHAAALHINYPYCPDEQAKNTPCSPPGLPPVELRFLSSCGFQHKPYRSITAWSTRDKSYAT